MIRSEQINELAAALSKAQGEFPVIPKNKVVDFTPNGKPRVFYRYADLADVISSTAPVLSKHGLAVTQDLTYVDKELVLETTIMHASGQYKTGLYPLRIIDKPQDQGAEITYARRYTLAAALGIHSDEDSDADPEYYDQRPQSAQQKPAAPQSFAPRPQAARPQGNPVR